MKSLCTLLAAALLGSATANAQTLPDWSGWWVLHITGAPPLVSLRFQPPALKPEFQAPVRDALARLAVDGTSSIDYCRPPEFAGHLNGEGFEDALEFLFTPGRVTLLTENGLVRRIYTDGRRPAEDPEPTLTGVSTGRWEGDTLVVETRGLMPSVRFPLRTAGAPSLGKDARVTERIRLRDADTLEINATLHAPELLTAPYQYTATYRRDRQMTALPMDNCPESDRLIDPVTRGTRFDLTPPPDLPPPPRPGTTR